MVVQQDTGADLDGHLVRSGLQGHEIRICGSSEEEVVRPEAIPLSHDRGAS